MNWDAVRKGVGETWRSTARVFQLVWQTSRVLTLTLAVMTLFMSVIPAAQVWLAGRLIDEVVQGIAGGGGNEYIRPIAILFSSWCSSSAAACFRR